MTPITGHAYGPSTFSEYSYNFLRLHMNFRYHITASETPSTKIEVVRNILVDSTNECEKNSGYIPTGARLELKKKIYV